MRNFQCGMIEHNGAEWEQSSAKCLDSLSVICNKHEGETERTDTWSDAVEFCGNASDKMHSHLTEAMVTKANRSNKYWLSTFRSFRVHDQYSQNTDACLSVTRTGNSLTLQPDDCDGIDEGNKNKIDDTDGKDDGNKDENRRSTTRQSTDKDGKPEEESKSSDNNSNPNNTTGVICLRRRKATKGAHRPLMNESSTDTNVIEGTYAISNTHRVSPNENEYASPEDVTNTVGSTNPNNSKIRPDKPARNTLRRNQKLNETYENFKFVSTENRNVDKNEVKCHDDVTKEDKDEYDILCHNKATPLAKLEHAEIHVYDHTTVQNDDHECYDSTLPGSGNKHKPARNAEDYDTFNISNIENVDYNKDALWNDAHNEEVSSFGVLKLDLTPEEEQEPVYTESG
ncbi:hypothetical protein MAR_035606 [Mya arenaria]|uniref:Uncharacterized protein n=1 Tax=Mya arenaria TaxID=6604 RepID=A0ABY7EL00_MYAAR|nr:hypothetical protein MAR_035606 [Mya arenaria]